jgi:hypothetical protein
MEALIGIFSSPGEYGARLASYINSHREIGYGGLSFNDNSEINEFLKSGELSILLTDNPIHLSTYKNKTRVCFLCEEKETAETDETGKSFYKFMRAPVLLQKLLPTQTVTFTKNDLITVFSPSSNMAAKAYALSIAENMAAEGKTLLICWDPFGERGKKEEGVSLSELLFAARRNRAGIGRILQRMECIRGVYVFGGTDFYTDLWQFTPEEMNELIRLCKTEGDFASVIFECSFISDAVERLMELSDEVRLVSACEGDTGPEEFLRQMEYGRKQLISAKSRVVRE